MQWINQLSQNSFRNIQNFENLLEFVKIRNNISQGIYLMKEFSLLEKEVLVSSISICHTYPLYLAIRIRLLIHSTHLHFALVVSDLKSKEIIKGNWKSEMRNQKTE